MALISCLKVPIDVDASTANINQPNSLGATIAVLIMAAAHRIDCVMIIFFTLIILLIMPTPEKPHTLFV